MIVFRWFAVAAATCAVTVVLGMGAINTFLPKVYTASAEIQVSLSIDPSDAEQENLRQTHVERMKSRALLSAVIQDLKLETAWEKWALRSKDSITDANAIEHLRKMLKIESIADTNLIRITIHSRNPQEAADIANKIAEKYKLQCDDEVIRYYSQQVRIDHQQSYWLDSKNGLTNTPADLWHTYGPTKKSTLKPLTAGDDITSQDPLRIINRAGVPSTGTIAGEPLYIGLILAAGLFLGVMVATVVEILLLAIREERVA